MNTNLLHNILNVATAVVAILGIPEVVALIPPALAMKIAFGTATLKLLINAFRDGLGGMLKDQPPVK